MTSLSEMIDYAKAKQPASPLAEIASHFIAGADAGYDEGHKEALKKIQRDEDNPLVVDRDTGEKMRLDPYIKLLDVKNKLLERDVNMNILGTLREQSDAKDTENRQASLGDIAVTASQAGKGGIAGLPVTQQDKITGIVTNPNSLGSAGRPTKKTITIENGKPKLSLEYGDAKRTTVQQMSAMKSYVDSEGSPESTAALSASFPDGMPDWATKFMAQHGELKMKKDAIQKEKDTATTQKYFVKMADALDPSKQRQGAFGVSKQVFDRAERLQSLASAFPDGNLDSRGMEELAIGLNAMLSGSNTGAQEQVKALVPKTAWGNAQKLTEWLVNEPRGTNQQAFVQRMMGSIEREKQTASSQIKRTQFSRIAPYASLESKDPVTFADTLQSNGIDPEEFKAWKANGFKPITAVQKAGTGDQNQSGPYGDSVVKDGKTFVWSPETGKYHLKS